MKNGNEIELLRALRNSRYHLDALFQFKLTFFLNSVLYFRKLFVQVSAQYLRDSE
jgi:hypothetical protein